MITNNYNKGRFPNKVKTLRNMAAEEVARQVNMEHDIIRGDPRLYAEAMRDPGASIGMVAARSKAFSNYSRRKEMNLNKINFQAEMQNITKRHLPSFTIDPQELRDHRDRVNYAFSDEAIHHATSLQYPDMPNLLHMKTPQELSEMGRMPDELPTKFVQFISDKLGIYVDGRRKQDAVEAIWPEFETTDDAASTLLVHLWREWLSRDSYDAL